MSLLVTPGQFVARRAVARGPLALLGVGLRTELEPLLRSTPDVPTEKALLTRAGGRCSVDGTYLTYDPFDLRHVCPRCGREFHGEVHDRFRLYWHQLWLAERTLHAAVLGVLLDDPACRTLAATLLDAYAAQYLRYPNEDNVLGPSRPFFSTYLESIWLLQLVLALDVLESASTSADMRALGGRVRGRIIAPSAALIASYDEGMSNRQVWNNAALLAAGRLLDDRDMAERAVSGPSGLTTHLRGALLADGTWYEGENYHLFAHRGLWYGVQLAEHAGYQLSTSLAARFRDGFAAPFRTLLPDLTYPSRRDSQYAVSVRQPRFAESCELGLARDDDERLVAMLARLYDPAVPRRETGRASSSADVERNLPATGLTRADLSWRALLLARAELPPLAAHPMGSDLLPSQGIAVLRRDGDRVVAALDYGHPGGGHGHPDRLNLLLADGDTRWFDDPGTGSYVDPALHWYRSTLAHTAPLLDGHSQPRVHGRLVAFEDSRSSGWVSAEAELAPGLIVRRSVIVLDDYLIDVLQWQGDAEHELALPLHGIELVDERDAPLPRTATTIEGGDASEDGFSFLQSSARVAPASEIVRALGVNAGRRLRGWIRTGRGASWWSAQAPDVPSRPGLVPLLLARHSARTGRFTSVWSWRDGVTDVDMDGDTITVTRADGGRDAHASDAPGWRIERTRPPASGPTRVVLGGTAHPSRGERVSGPTAAVPVHDVRSSTSPHVLPFSAELGEAHYRPSEDTWHEAGEPRATVKIRTTGLRTLVIDLEVSPSDRIFVPIDAENLFDNEPMAINGDGVQLYVAAGDRSAGWLLVPRVDSTDVDARPAGDWRTELPLRAHWRPTNGGWALSAEIELPRSTTGVELDLLVNETAPGRQRRRGQLVLSGARGEFVYLRGDRHERDRLLCVTLPDV